VSKAKIWVEQKPWKRMTVDGEPHDHGVLQRHLSGAFARKTTTKTLPDGSRH